MKRLFVVCALVVACAPPPAAPAPASLTVGLTPQQVAQRAAQRLAAEGFSITTSDAAAGVVTATLTRTGQGDYGPLVACRFGPDAIGRKGMTTVLTTQVSAAPATGGSSVVIGTTSMTTYGAESAAKSLGSGSASTTDCASTGEIERRIAASLTTP